MINDIQPRAGMVTHFPYEEDLVAEAIAGIRAHWKGLFLWGAPDGVVVNVTKDAIWSRKAAIPESTGQNPPPFAILTGEPVPKELTVPQPRRTREEQQEQYTRDTEIDPKKYIPEDVYREPLVQLPDPMVIDLEEMMKAGGTAKKDE